jgi:hypothetical protein
MGLETRCILSSTVQSKNGINRQPRGVFGLVYAGGRGRHLDLASGAGVADLQVAKNKSLSSESLTSPTVCRVASWGNEWHLRLHMGQKVFFVPHHVRRWVASLNRHPEGEGPDLEGRACRKTPGS